MREVKIKSATNEQLEFWAPTNKLAQDELNLRNNSQLRLRIFAYHVSVIFTMDALETHTLSPIGKLRVKVEKSSDIVNEYCQDNQFTTIHPDKD